MTMAAMRIAQMMRHRGRAVDFHFDDASVPPLPLAPRFHFVPGDAHMRKLIERGIDLQRARAMGWKEEQQKKRNKSARSTVVKDGGGVLGHRRLSKEEAYK